MLEKSTPHPPGRGGRRAGAGRPKGSKSSRPGSGRPRSDKGPEAYRLREEDGLSWLAISAQLGLKSPAAARSLVLSHRRMLKKKAAV